MAQLAGETVPLTELIRQEGKRYESAGLQAFDALHLASANGSADVFLTTDDRFLKKARQLIDLRIKVLNPLQWLEEILL